MRAAALLLTLLLVAVRPVAADEVDVLLQGLGAESPSKRLEAVLALREKTAPADRGRILPAMTRALADPVSAVRREVALALGAYGDLGAAGPLEARLGVEMDPSVLTAVVLSLGQVRATGAAPRLADLAKAHPAPSVRSAALTALGELGGPLARATALEVVKAPGRTDPEWAVRASAVLALAHCGHADDVGVVLAAYRKGGGAQYWFARAALATLVGARAREPLPTLRQLVLDQDPRVALTAAIQIARTGHREEMTVLLRHTASTVRAAAASAVARESLAYAYPRLRTLARFDRAVRVRWAASLALFRVEDPEGDELVLLGLQASEPTIWAEAMAALARRTGQSHGRNAAAWREALRRWRQERGK